MAHRPWCRVCASLGLARCGCVRRVGHLPRDLDRDGLVGQSARAVQQREVLEFRVELDAILETRSCCEQLLDAVCVTRVDGVRERCHVALPARARLSTDWVAALEQSGHLREQRAGRIVLSLECVGHQTDGCGQSRRGALGRSWRRAAGTRAGRAGFAACCLAPPRPTNSQPSCTVHWPHSCVGVGVGKRTSSVLSSSTANASRSMGRRRSRSLDEQQRLSCFCMAREPLARERVRPRAGSLLSCLHTLRFRAKEGVKSPV